MIMRYLGQGIAYALFILLVAYLATDPHYVHLPEDKALLRLSFVHAGQRKGECRELTANELSKLAPNMRGIGKECPRERLPIMVELEFDGKLLYQKELKPTGFWSDSAATVYQRFIVDPGEHRVAIRLRDSARAEGFDYEHEAEIELHPRQNFVVDFDNEIKKFIFK